MTATPQRTPFFVFHQEARARIVEFSGWEMPIQFEGILAEHQAVRQRAGLFDISHMAQIWVTGPGARSTLDRLVTNDVSALKDNRGLYALLCREDGGVVDDLYIYRLESGRYLVIANASRARADWAWLQAHLGPETELAEQTQAAALALPGPQAAAVLKELLPNAVKMQKNDVAEWLVLGREMVVARTGYTGEDGFEFFGPAEHILPFHQALIKAGAPHGLVPCGLGARDTLRLEMGYRLYGNDLDEGHSALESGLGWAVKLGKTDFIGRAALLKEKEQGSRRRMIAFRLKERGVPRHGHEILLGGNPVGAATSGTFSPSLGGGIGLGYVDNVLFPPAAEKTNALSLRIYERPLAAEIATLPFYRKTTLTGVN